MNCSMCGKETNGVTYKYISPNGNHEVYVCADCLKRVFELMAKRFDKELVNYLSGGTKQ